MKSSYESKIMLRNRWKKLYCGYRYLKVNGKKGYLDIVETISNLFKDIFHIYLFTTLAITLLNYSHILHGLFGLFSFFHVVFLCCFPFTENRKREERKSRKLDFLLSQRYCPLTSV